MDFYLHVFPNGNGTIKVTAGLVDEARRYSLSLKDDESDESKSSRGLRPEPDRILAAGTLKLDVMDMREVIDYVGDRILGRGARPVGIERTKERWFLVYDKKDEEKIFNSGLFSSFGG